MAIQEYRCKICDHSVLSFEDEFTQDGRCDEHTHHCWEVQPPVAVTVIATNLFMLDFPQLDSIHTIYELDRQLNIEAREEKEMKEYQDFIKNQ